MTTVERKEVQAKKEWEPQIVAQVFADGVTTIVEQVRALGPLRSEWK